MDLFPTLCEATGVSVNHEIEGKTILPTLLGQKQRKNDRYLFFVRREGYRYQGCAYYAVRKGLWKLSQNEDREIKKYITFLI